MDFFIGLDIGTSSVKGVLMDELGKKIKIFSLPFEYYGEEKQSLMNVNHFVDTCFNVIANLASFKNGGKIKAICSCAASGNLILIDKNMNPLTPIIGWRSSVDYKDLDLYFTKEEQASFYNMTGWPFDCLMPTAYLTWFNIHRKDILDKTEVVAMHVEYLNYLLTSKWGISSSMCTLTFLMDQEKKTYNENLLKKLNINNKTLPPIYEKGTVLGEVNSNIAKKLGLDLDTKIILGSFDHPSGAYGAGIFDDGDLLLSCGTSWVELFPVKSREFALSTNGLVDYFMNDGMPYCVMKALTSITEKINDYRKHFFGEISFESFDELLIESRKTENNIFFDFNYNDFERAINMPSKMIAKAIIESAALLLKNNLIELEKIGLNARKISIIGGITHSKVSIDIISDFLKLPLEIINGQEAGAVGSALLAAVGTKNFKNIKEAFEKMKEINKEGI